MCHCDKSPVLVGQGLAEDPYELEYADEVVLPSPNPLSYATPPIENKAPIPTPAPASVLEASDKENCKRCPITPLLLVGQLVPIEEMAIDHTEDTPRVAKVHLTQTGQCCKCSQLGRVGHMAASNPYHLPVESDGNKSGPDEGRRFKYRVQQPLRQVELEIQHWHLTRLAVQDSTQGSDEGDGGSLADYVDSAADTGGRGWFTESVNCE
jgi:hypothetical protein